MKISPDLVDNERGDIFVSVEGRAIRMWTYQDDIERRQKMRLAREFIEGWCNARDYFTPKDAA